ncbi:MAG: hypothetical protein ACR2IK_07120 [Chloroflexota bacterium]
MGFDEKTVCEECHTAGTPQWRTASSSMQFAGRDTLTVCRPIRKTIVQETGDPDQGAAFIRHIATDELVGVGSSVKGAPAKTAVRAT